MPSSTFLIDSAVVFDRLKSTLDLRYDTDLNVELEYGQFNHVNIIRGRKRLSTDAIGRVIRLCQRKGIDLNWVFRDAII